MLGLGRTAEGMTWLRRMTRETESGNLQNMWLARMDHSPQTRAMRTLLADQKDVPYGDDQPRDWTKAGNFF